MVKSKLKSQFKAKIIIFLALPLLLLCFLANKGLSLEPPTGEQLARYRADGTLPMRIKMAESYGNHLVPSWVVERLQYKINRLALEKKGIKAEEIERVLAPPPSWRGMPTRGNVRILALLIAFSDYPGVTPSATFTSSLFGNGEGGYPQESLRNYYRRASYNQLNIEGDVLGWYTTSYPRSNVSTTTTGRENLIKEALNYFDSQGLDFSRYDSDGDGAIDYFCVFWTGPRGEWASFWWGYYTSFSDSSYRLDGKRLRNYSWQWELANYPSGSFTPRVVIHETGHALGVPDYYDYDDSVGPRGGVGGLDIMDANVGDHNCFSKFMLDWITPTVVSAGPQSLTLRASGDTQDALLFMPDAQPGRIFSEYFMVQNRYRIGNDSGLFTGTDGLLIWHVNALLNSSGTSFLYNNSYTEYKLLRLVQADGLDEIERFASRANAGDYYRAGMTFGPATYPNSNRYNGTPTAMGVWNITGTTTPMSLEVFSNDARPTCSIINLISGQTVYGTIMLEILASDDKGVSKVEIYGDSDLYTTLFSPPYNCQFDTRVFANGTRVISAVAYDTIMQTTTSSVTVSVDNIFAPANPVARRVVNRGAVLREIINVLTWSDNVRNTSVGKYRIYLEEGGGRTLLAEVPKNQGSNVSSYQYLHRRLDPKKTYSYYLVGVGNMNREGDPARITAR